MRYSGWWAEGIRTDPRETLKEARKEKTEVRKLAKFTLRVDGILLLTPAIGYYLAPLESTYLTLPGIPIIYLAVVSGGLRLFRSVLTYSLGVYTIVAAPFGGLLQDFSCLHCGGGR
jgi:hypothetical protein